MVLYGRLKKQITFVYSNKLSTKNTRDKLLFSVWMQKRIICKYCKKKRQKGRERGIKREKGRKKERKKERKEERELRIRNDKTLIDRLH